MIKDFTDLSDVSIGLVIGSSFLLCGAIFVILRSFLEYDRRYSSTLVSIFHHVVVVLLGIWSLNYNLHHVMHNSVLSQSSKFPAVNTIQFINIGYFLYDSVHALTWEHNFIIHHMVALAGFLVSHFSGLGGLGNVTNTIIAEIGSIMYNVYNKHKSRRNYILFVSIYGITRLVFILWTFWVFGQLWHGYKSESYAHCLYFIKFVFIFQALLVFVNIQFLWIHMRKASNILWGTGIQQKTL